MSIHVVPKIVIVGGGAGGLHLATGLSRSLSRKARAEITLVDETLSHMWKPSLHEFAAGTKGTDEETSFLEHANRTGYQFRLGRFAGVNSTEKRIILEPVNDALDVPLAPRREIPYDYLVIAIGSRSNDFGCKGVKENCWFLDTPAQAKRLQSELLNSCLRLETGALGDDTTKLNVCIIGGGATGVELAAELREATEQLSLHGIDKLQQPNSFKITVIEAGPRLLAALPEELSEKVASKLEQLDIAVRASSRVSEVTKDAVILDTDEKIAADMVIWAAGIKAPEILKSMEDIELASLGRIKVHPSLQLDGHPDIYAMGDCAECDWVGTKEKLPPRAQVAAQQAEFLQKQFGRALEGKPLKDFHYIDRGSLVAVSSASAVGAFMGKVFGTFTMEGWIARWGYRYLHFDHEASIQGSFRAFMRIILKKAMKRIRPQLKLH